MNYAPVVVFSYNRPWHIQQTIEALKNNDIAEKSDLIIFSDGPKNERITPQVHKVRDYLRRVTGFRSVKVIAREENLGLAKSIIEGVTQVVHEYGRVIVLEDDLVTGRYFLNFMNEALDLYKSDLDVAQIVGYSYFEKYRKHYALDDSLFIKGADCLGWATWENRWALFNSNSLEMLTEIKNRKIIRDFNINNSYDYYNLLRLESQGKVNSWAIQWYASAFLHDRYTLYPSQSLVLHIGNDGQGTNYTPMRYDPLVVPLFQGRVSLTKLPVYELPNSRMAYARFLRQFTPPLGYRIYKRLQRLLRSLR